MRYLWAKCGESAVQEIFVICGLNKFWTLFLQIGQSAFGLKNLGKIRKNLKALTSRQQEVFNLD